MPAGPFSSRDMSDDDWDAAQSCADQDRRRTGNGRLAPVSGGNDEVAAFQRMMADPREEGRRNEVYRDSLGYPTVGIGHLVRPEDNLQVGQRITDAEVDAFFRRDAAPALRAAAEQAAEAGIEDPEFIRRLAAVNFQLGAAKWPSAFPKTWGLIRAGDYEAAARELYNSRWAKQTPHRVAAFRDALLRLTPTRFSGEG